MLKSVKEYAGIACVGVLALCITACSGTASSDQKQQEASPAAGVEKSSTQSAYKPVEIENFNAKTVFEKEPQKIVVFKYNQAEILTALGLADRVVALREDNQSIENVKPEYKDKIAAMPKPDEINVQKGLPTLENLIGVNPDLMILDSYYFNVPTFGKVEDYKSRGVNLYVTEGSYVSGAGIENTYNDIKNLSEIFGKQKEAAELIEAMKKKVAAVPDSGKNLSVMFLDDERKGLAAVAGGGGLANNLAQLAHVENVFKDVEQQWAPVPWEEVISRDPDYIVILEYPVEGDAQRKIDLIKSKPELAELKAVKNNAFVVMPLSQVFPGIANADAVEHLAKSVK